MRLVKALGKIVGGGALIIFIDFARAFYWVSLGVWALLLLRWTMAL